MLTGVRIYFKVSQEKLKNKLLPLKETDPLVLGQTVGSHVPTFPVTLLNKKLLQVSQRHQILRENTRTGTRTH